MQFVITAMAVIAGMVFSLAIGLLVEEFIFGKIFGLLFARQRVNAGAMQTVRVVARGRAKAV